MWTVLTSAEMGKREVIFSVVDEKPTNPLGLPLGEVRLKLADFAKQSEGNLARHALAINAAVGGRMSGDLVAGVSLRRKNKGTTLDEAHALVPETVRISGSWTG